VTVTVTADNPVPLRATDRKSDTWKAGTCADACGPGWDRTSDLPRVKRTLSH
jgi:hypothetical protein